MSNEMSQDSADLFRKWFAAWNSGDMAGVRALVHPDVIVRGLEGWPEPGPFVGRDAYMRELGFIREAYEVDTFEPVGEPREIANHVVFRAIWHGSGRGPDLNMEFSMVIAVRNRAIFGVEYFWDHSEALASVGLSE